MWVVDDSDDAIYAYTLATGERNSDKDVSGLAAAGNRHPRGIWSDGTTMWVSDSDDKKLYAYDVSALVVPKPDLRVIDMRVNNRIALAMEDTYFRGGVNFTLSAVVRNNGLANAGSSTLHWYRSSDSTIDSGDMQIGTDSTSSLSPFESERQSIVTSVPTNTDMMGAYYYYACVDAVSGESFTENNCSQAFKINAVNAINRPELVVRLIKVGDTHGDINRSIITYGRVYNIGSVSTKGWEIIIRWYFAHNPDGSGRVSYGSSWSSAPLEGGQE